MAPHRLLPEVTKEREATTTIVCWHR